MERLRVTPRLDAAARLESQGLSFHARDRYWREDACYRFTAAEVDTLEAAAAELHSLCRQALPELTRPQRLRQLGIPESMWPIVHASVERDDFSLYGRFDLAFDGTSPPKLLEYNADTPTSLLESAVCQWYWLQDVFPNADQFNSIHERLIARWQQLDATGPVHLACVADNEEDWACVAYLMDTAVQAGRDARQVHVEDIGWDIDRWAYVDLGGQPIGTLFKLYPWEWLMREDFSAHLGDGGTRFIEPPWKAVLSCKGMLAVLWELFPEHPNLLPTYFDAGTRRSYVRKPFYSREGANVEIVQDGARVAATDGPYVDGPAVYQAYHPLPQFDGFTPVIGAWIVGDEPAGIGLREDAGPITNDASHFVPHFF
jgi:glutathionylspermidine synthase